MPNPDLTQTITVLGLSGDILSTTILSDSKFRRQQIEPELRASMDRGTEAIQRINQHKTFADWLIVGEALSARQKAAIDLANGSTKGILYNLALEFLSSQYPELNKISSKDANHAIWMYDNKDKIISWHENLPTNIRQRINHPYTIRLRFKRDTEATGDDDNADDSSKPLTGLRLQVWELAQENAELSTELASRDESLERCLWILALPEIRAILIEKEKSDPEIRAVLSELRSVFDENHDENKTLES